MHRKRWFWAAFATLSLAGTAFAWWGFAKAFPLVSLELEMDRETALARARVLAAKLDLGPASARAAAAFELDARAQTFVELEAGGAERVRELVAAGPFSLHAWRVRLFRPGERHEAEISFTPAGRPWGFRESLPEDAPGAALDPEEARDVALGDLQEGPWQLALEDWEEVERSRELRPSGRVDHGFTWRHRSADFGDGELRLRLSVAGDRLTELRRWVQVPEAFDRRYERMRSTNEAIALWLGSTGLGAFFMAGVGAALVLLLRRRLLAWRAALAWGFFIAALQAAALLNAWPLSFMHYDTALSPGLFGALQVVQALAALLVLGPLIALTFVAAEGLSRAAFPNHPRLWSLWSKEVASTTGVLGRSVAGYLLVGLFFAYEVALYLVSSRYLGWWSPIGALQDPDALATAFPWLNAIAISAQAGFWEEALCRAIPLSLAMLVGRRLGRSGLFVAIALVVQALVFGAAHASYPAQPAHARLVELLLPSLGFGLIFLRFGLLTAVLCHYVYDVVWIALPLFASSAPGASLQRGLVILFAALPLLVVVVARLRAGRWSELAPEHLNGSWEPSPAPAEAERAVEKAPHGLSQRGALLVGAAGLLGLVAWVGLARFEPDSPALSVSRAEALERARGELAARGVELGPDWRALGSVSGEPSEGDRLAWRELGRAAYGDYLRDWTDEPSWQVRRARFDGELEERAEEWRIAVSASGRARVRHVLPEHAAGPRLGEDLARALALSEIARRFELGADELEQVEALPDRLPERTDWRFVFRSAQAWSGERGEARILADVAGAEVVRLLRFTHVPEEWSRVERDRQVRVGLARGIGLALLGLLFLGALLGSVAGFATKRFDLRAALAAFALVAATALLQAWNAFPSALAWFSTARPWSLQVAQAAGALVAGALASAGAAALLSGFAGGWSRPGPGQSQGSWRRVLLAALGLAGIAAGLLSLSGRLAGRLEPSWGDISAVAERLPLLAELLGGWTVLVVGSSFLLVLVAALDHALARWPSRSRLCTAAASLVGLCAGLAAGGPSLLALALTASAGALLGAPALLLLRRAPAAAPAAVAGLLAIGRVQAAIEAAHPAQPLGAGLSALLLLAAGLWWSRRGGSAAKVVAERDNFAP